MQSFEPEEHEFPVLVTGGAGFIGSAVCRHLCSDPKVRVVVLDKLTYAGRLVSLQAIWNRPGYHFVQGDICDEALVSEVLRRHEIDIVMHLAAERHVDRWARRFRADELRGDLSPPERVPAVIRRTAGAPARALPLPSRVHGRGFRPPAFQQRLLHRGNALRPSSPYSSTKAAADHLVRAWHETYGLPAVISNCSNNYGPFHFPEKLVPLVILNALEGKPLLVCGDGANVRDWLFVEDHARALEKAARKGRIAFG